jgi:hypothetical protein
MLMSGGQLARHFVYATMGLFEVLIWAAKHLDGRLTKVFVFYTMCLLVPLRFWLV